MSDFFGDFETWLHDVGEDRVFRVNVYKRMFTPYEQAKQFTDETEFVDTYSKPVRIKEVIPLGNGDFYIGFVSAYAECKDIEYYKLSEIRLTFIPTDMENEDFFDDLE